MLKRFFLALIVAMSPIAAHAVGTIPLSMTQQLDMFGVPLSGCQLYTIQAGTTSTPQNAYKDTALSIAQPNPMICDASGRLPQFFLADGQIKIRLLDKLGNPQVVLDNILVVGPSSGGGGGGSVDPTTIASTGDIKQAYGTQILSGWVRFNGRSIGNAVSGASERANADTQALFLYLWAADPNLLISPGRGASAAADYAANKTMSLPDGRERTLAGLGDMGNADAGRLTVGNFGCSPVVLGCAGGTETKALSATNMALYAPTVSFTLTAQPIFQGTNGGGNVSTPAIGGNNTGTVSGTPLAVSGTITVPGNGGASTPFAITQPTLLVTIYIKL